MNRQTFFLSHIDQTINIHAWDEDNGSLDPDDDLGTANISVGNILLAGKSMSVELQQNHKGTGAFVALRCNVCELTPDLQGTKGASLEFKVYIRGIKEEPDQDPTLPSLSVSASGPPADGAAGDVRITAVKAWGFQIQKKRLVKNDIPDVYCDIRFGSSPHVWRTSTVKNSTTPEWNEASNYPLVDHGQIICIDVFDEDKERRDADDKLGNARTAVGKLLLAGGAMDVELQSKGSGTGCYVKLRCDIVDASY
jgi:hypothetical protein